MKCFDDVDQAFCKLVLIGNAIEYRDREGEWLIRVVDTSPRRAMRKLGALLDGIEAHRAGQAAAIPSPRPT